MSSTDKTAESSRREGRSQTQSRQPSSSRASIDNRQFNRDGSVSSVGLFDGLTGRQAKKTLDAILEEYNEWRTIHDQNFAKESGFGRIEDYQETGREKRARDDDDDEGTSTDSESETDAKKLKARKTLERLLAKWLERGWVDHFKLYSAIPELKSKPELWNKLLEFLWTALSKANMIEVQFLLLRVRSAKMLEIDWTFRPDTGTAIDEGQTALFAAYDQIRNCNADEHLHNVLLRFHLVRLFETHEAEVHRRVKGGTAENEARKLVNANMVRAFKYQNLPEIDTKHLKRKLLQGKHWSELVRSEYTKDFGFGLLLLLPQANAVTIAQNTPYEVWKFLLTRFASIDIHLMLMCLALQKLGESVYANGICNHDVPLFGYELLKATDLRNHSAASYKTYWRQYPQIPKHAAMELMQLRERSKDIDVFPRLLEQDWQESNKEEVHFIEQRQKQLVAEAKKRIKQLESAKNRAKAKTFSSRVPRNSENEGESSTSASQRGRISQLPAPIIDLTTKVSSTSRQRSKRPRHRAPVAEPAEPDQSALPLSSNPSAIPVLDSSTEVPSGATISVSARTIVSDPITTLLEAADKLASTSSSSINHESTIAATISPPTNQDSMDVEQLESAAHTNVLSTDAIQATPPPLSPDSNVPPPAQPLSTSVNNTPTPIPETDSQLTHSESANHVAPCSRATIHSNSDITTPIPLVSDKDTVEGVESADNTIVQSETGSSMPHPSAPLSTVTSHAQPPTISSNAPTASHFEPDSITLNPDCGIPPPDITIPSINSNPTHVSSVSQLFHQESMDIDQPVRDIGDTESTSQPPQVLRPQRLQISPAQRSRQSASALRSYRSPMPSPSFETLRRALYSNSLHALNPETHQHRFPRPALVASAVVIIQSTQTTATGHPTSSRVDQTGNLHLAVTQIDIQVPNSQGIGWQDQQSAIRDSARVMELDTDEINPEVVPDTQLPPTQAPNEQPLPGDYSAPSGENIIPENWDTLTDEEWYDIFNREMAEADRIRDMPHDD